MGFPSPSMDYAESALTVSRLCNYDVNCRAVETSQGYAVINVSKKATQGAVVLFSFHGHVQFAKVRGRSLITDDGEAIEGSALDDAVVIGVLTHLINRATPEADEDIPVM
ncbi:hypothetical protein HVZ29_15015 [Escherichia coli]|nr:hypothetical protein HVZ29_15015 [Escherichia coli]